MCFDMNKRHSPVMLSFASVFLSDSPNISPYMRSMQAQKIASAYPVAGQRPNSSGHTTLRTRPLAIPVRTQVTGNEIRSQHSSATGQQMLGMLSAIYFRR